MRLLVALVLLVAACDESLVDHHTAIMIDRELETARLGGHRARFETVDRDEALDGITPDPRVTRLVLAPHRARIVPSADLHFSDELLKTTLAVWVDPYLALDQPHGAARALTRAYSQLLRTSVGYRPSRALAPLLPPERGSQFSPSHTVGWGLPLALLVFALAWRRRQKLTPA